MVKNVGKVDRVARIVAGCFLFFLAWAPGVVLSADPSVDYGITIGLWVVGAYLVITALFGTCLIYRAIDVDTCVHSGTYHSGEDVFDGRGGN
jgi:hypothetical protein